MPRKSYIVLAVCAWLLLGASCVRFSSGPGSDPTVWRSDDRGTTWQGKDFVNQVVEKKKTRTIAITGVSARAATFSPPHPEKMYLQTDANGVYVSNNRGDQWTQLGYTQFVRGFSIDPVDDAIMYVTGGVTVQKSTDNGGTWTTKFTTTKADEVLVGLVVDAFNPKRIVATSSTGLVYVSDDAAETWRILATIKDSLNGLFASPVDSRILFTYGTGDGLWRSTDSGSTWVSLRTAFDALPESRTNLSVSFVGQTNVLFAVGSYGLLRSTNLGDSWLPVRTLLPPPTRIEQVVVDPRDTQKITFITAGRLHRTDDAGANWDVSALPMRRPIAFLTADPIDPSVLYIGTKPPPK